MKFANQIVSKLPSECDPKFFQAYYNLSKEAQTTIYRTFQMWCQDPSANSLDFKPLPDTNNVIWRINCGKGKFRAVATKQGNLYQWFWCGSHNDYDKLCYKWRNQLYGNLTPGFWKQPRATANWYQEGLRVESANADRFCQGYCVEFAIALNKVFRWPTGAFVKVVKEQDEDVEFYELAHAFAINPGGQIADARGLRNRDAVKNLCISLEPNPNITLKMMTPEDLEGLFGVDDQAFEEAIDFIKQNRKLWSKAATPDARLPRRRQ